MLQTKSENDIIYLVDLQGTMLRLVRRHSSSPQAIPFIVILNSVLCILTTCGLRKNDAYNYDACNIFNTII